MEKLEQIIKKIAVPAGMALALTLTGCQSLEQNIGQKYSRSALQIETRRSFPSAYSPRYDTTTHHLLLIEEEFGFEASVFNKLDEIIGKARENIPKTNILSEENVRSILTSIGNVLNEYDSGKLNQPLLSQSLLNNNLDCDVRSMLYMAVCESINLPVQLMYVPEHVYIRVPVHGSHIAWETTSNRQLDESKFDKKFSNTLYPIVMDARKLMAAVYDNMGLAWLKNTEPLTGLDFFYAEKNISKAIELFPDFWDAHYNMATLYMDQKENLKSLREFSNSIILWDSDAITYNQRGIILKRLNRADEAIADFSKAIMLKPDFKTAYLNRSLEYSEKGMTDEALSDFTKYEELSQPLK
jgi:regulator of sirC expression with transglutaminase-like and TPR domain